MNEDNKFKALSMDDLKQFLYDTAVNISFVCHYRNCQNSVGEDDLVCFEHNARFCEFHGYQHLEDCK